MSSKTELTIKYLNAHTRRTKTCWLWTGAQVNGYGSFRHNRRRFYAHRLRWILSRGLLPTEVFVCHSCDNPLCNRLSHLWLGTKADNFKDMNLKGRNVRGEDCPWSKLTWGKVYEARRLYRTGQWSTRELARKYKVDQKVIWRAVTRKTWKGK